MHPTPLLGQSEDGELVSVMSQLGCNVASGSFFEGFLFELYRDCPKLLSIRGPIFRFLV